MVLAVKIEALLLICITILKLCSGHMLTVPTERDWSLILASVYMSVKLFLANKTSNILLGFCYGVAPSEQASMAINPKMHAMPIHVQTRRRKSWRSTKTPGQPSIRKTRWMSKTHTLTIASRQSSEQRTHEALNHRREDCTLNYGEGKDGRKIREIDQTVALQLHY